MSEPGDFAARYARMSKGELIALAQSYDQLIESAQIAIREEFAKRQLEPPVIKQPEPLPEWSELTTVGRFRDLAEAAVARSALESSGVATYLFDDNMVRMNWGYSNLVGGIRLQVRRADESSAREMLSQPVPESIPFSDNESYQQPHCPRCGSINISFYAGSRGAALIGLYAAGVPLPTGGEYWSCSDCGAKWEETAD
jgi:hypothetical protein